ncbi:hypothetical protein NT90_16810 [Acinetobacter baumannii]|nr:hypothetical protein NT90_16810 [Acinetobacter baumannii]
MGGKFVARAGQHKFESGEKIVSPVAVLPTAPNSYSHKVNYKFEYTDENGEKIDPPEDFNKQVFVIDTDSKKLLVQRNLNNSNEDTTLRFYTAEARPFKALLFNSENIRMDKPDDIFFNEDEVDDTSSFDGISVTDSDE